MSGIRLALAGDVMLGRLEDAALAARGPESPWQAVLPLLEGTETFLFNLECAICEDDVPLWEPDEKAFHFRMSPSHMSTLSASRAGGVLVANNHTMDHGSEGLRQTLLNLDRLGLPHAGAGATLDLARKPAIIRTRRHRIALVGASDHLAEWAATDTDAGIFLFDPSEGARCRNVLDEVARAREDADIVVLGLHWGPNMRRVPPAAFRRFAHEAVEAGADVIWGTSAHLFQGIEFHKGAPIIYDAGDYIDDYAIDPREHNDRTFLFRVRLGEPHLRDGVELAPVTIEDRRARPSTDAEAEWSVARMSELCEPLGTRVTRECGHWLAAPRHEP